MLRTPLTLNSEVYVQISPLMFDVLRNAKTNDANMILDSLRDAESIDYKLYTTVKPYLRKDNKICRYTIDRPLPNCYLLVREFTDEDVNVNSEFAFKYLNIMHGVTRTSGDDSTDCTLLNVNRGARFYVNSEDFNGEYAYWCLQQLDLICDSEASLSELTLGTTIGNINITRSIVNDVEVIPIPAPSSPIIVSPISPPESTELSDDAKEVASMFDMPPPTPRRKNSGDDITEFIYNNLTPGSTDAVRRPRMITLPAAPRVATPSSGWSEHLDDKSRYDKEAMLKHAISILSLPIDPEFVNENTAVRRAMYALFWELNQ